MAVRAHHLGVSFIIASIFLGSLAFLAADPRTAQASCASGSNVLITSPSTASTTGSPLTNITTLKAKSSLTSASGMTFMLMPSGTPLGAASISGTEWNLSWDTRNQPNGSFQLIAIAHFGNDSALDCASSAMPIYINNTATQSPKLTASISPSTLQIPVGASATYSIDTIYVDQYGRSSHVTPSGVSWHSTLGGANPNGGPTTVFTAGSTLATGTLTADVGYNSLMVQVVSQVKVVAPTSTAPSGSGTISNSPTPTPKPSVSPTPNTAQFLEEGSAPSPSPVTPAEATRLGAMVTIFRPAVATNSDPVVSINTLGCMEKGLGVVRFGEISAGKNQPSAQERKTAGNCFSGSEAIPSVLAPVAPLSLRELPTTSDFVTLNKIKNQIVTASDGKKINGLLLSGSGAPNTSVYIYVFSDPLVLRAETNSSGTWSYVVETPLPGGKHEVYAVAEKDSSNFVRTSAIPITIAAAAPGSSNGTLVIDQPYSAAQIGFAAAAALMVLAAIGVFMTLIRRRRKAAGMAAAAGNTAGLIVPNESHEIQS